MAVRNRCAQRMLDAIEDIQNRARSNNSDDDVVADILLTATHRPHGHTFTTGGTTISSTTQYSVEIDGVSRERMLAIAEYGADGMLDVRARVQHTSTVVTGLFTTAPEALVSRIKDIPEAGWKGVEFRDESRSWYWYVDALSDINGNSDSDYLVLGYWVQELKVPRDDDNYRLGVFASGNDPFESSNLTGLAGTATYEGPATGLHMTKENADAEPTFDYFNAKANLTADFGDTTTMGSISGTITEGMTDGGEVLPEVTLGSADISPNSSSEGRGGNYSGDTSGMTDTGVTFTGYWGGKFFSNGTSGTDHPGSVAGTFGAKSADDLQAITGAFGAYKQ